MAPGSYEVFTTWVEGADRATNAPYSIFIDGVSQGAARLRNQQVAADDGVYGGRTWESLGVFNVALGGIAVQLSDAANGVVVADGVIAVPLNVAAGEGEFAVSFGAAAGEGEVELSSLPALVSLDADNDGAVAPGDALMVINQINAGVRMALGPSGLGGAFSIDVNADQSISPLDALLVINDLNNKKRIEDAEAEAADVLFADLAGPLAGDLWDYVAAEVFRTRPKRRT